MPFNSFNFWVVFPLLFGLYWLVPSRLAAARKGYLVAVSYLLYMCFKPAFALVLLFVTLTTFYGAKCLEGAAHRRKMLGWSLALTALMPLLAFKYYDFVSSSLLGVYGMLWGVK